MDKLISKYGLAAHLALVAVAPLVLKPIAVLWLLALAAVWFIVEPSRLGKETLHQARPRMMRTIVRDPVFWVLIFLLIVASIRAFNTGIMLDYNGELEKWVLTSPQFQYAPGSVEGEGLPHFTCVLLCLVLVTAARHALGKQARLSLALFASSFSGLIALVTVIFFRDEMVNRAMLCATDTPVYFGTIYGIYLAISVISLVSAVENQWPFLLPLVFCGICGNAVGLVMFAPPVIIALYVGIIFILLVYSFVYLRLKVGRLSDFKALVGIGLALTLAGIVVMAVMSSDLLASRIAPFQTGEFFSVEYLGLREKVSEFCMRVWTLHPWLGTGLGSFDSALQFYATEADWKVLPPLLSGPTAGYWLIMVERGIVGVFALAVPLVLLLIYTIMNLVRGIRLAIPHPLACLGLLLFVAIGVDLTFACTVLKPETLVVFALFITLSANTFPKENKKNG